MSFSSLSVAGLVSVLSMQQSSSEELDFYGWQRYQDIHINPACTHEEYIDSSLGTFSTADECIEAARNYPNVNYVVWRGDADGGCHTCDISQRESFI